MNDTETQTKIIENQNQIFFYVKLNTAKNHNRKQIKINNTTYGRIKYYNSTKQRKLLDVLKKYIRQHLESFLKHELLTIQNISKHHTRPYKL